MWGKGHVLKKTGQWCQYNQGPSVPPGWVLPFGLLRNWVEQGLWKFPVLPGSPAQAELAQNLNATISMANGLNAYIYNEGF